MEHKPYLIGFTVFVAVVVICLNWYVGLNSYVLEEDVSNEIYYTYQEALVIGEENGIEITPDRQYLRKERNIIVNKKSMVPFVFKTDTIFHEAGYFSREK